MKVQDMAKAMSLIRVHHLLCVLRGNGGYEVRINRPAFHEVYRSVIMIVLQSVLLEQLLRVGQAGGIQDMVTCHPLMFKIVDGVADALIRHAAMLIELIQQYRNQSCLPVVAVNNVRSAVVFEHEFQCRLAEEGKTLSIVMEAVILPPFKKTVFGMRLYEKTLSPLYEAKPDIAPDGSAVPGYPQIAISDVQTPDMVIAHAIVLGQYYLDVVAPYLQLSGEPEDHISQPPHFCYGGAFSRNH